MKTLAFVPALVALAAFAVYPPSLEFTLSLTFGLGLATLLVADYKRTLRPLRLDAAPAPMANATRRNATRRTERFGLAA